jgi:hypothetical protein
VAGRDSPTKKRHSAEQIVGKLRQADVALGQGLAGAAPNGDTASEAARCFRALTKAMREPP